MLACALECVHVCLCVCVFGDWQGQGQECPLPGMRKVKKSRIRDVWSLGQSRPWKLEECCNIRVRAGGSELQTRVNQETPQAGLRFGGEIFALAEQEPLFLVTSLGQFRESAQRSWRRRGHRRQCPEHWKHIQGGHLNISALVAGCCDGLAVRLGLEEWQTTVPTVPRQGVLRPQRPWMLLQEIWRTEPCWAAEGLAQPPLAG